MESANWKDKVFCQKIAEELRAYIQYHPKNTQVSGWSADERRKFLGILIDLVSIIHKHYDTMDFFIPFHNNVTIHLYAIHTTIGLQ